MLLTSLLVTLPVLAVHAHTCADESSSVAGAAGGYNAAGAGSTTFLTATMTNTVTVAQSGAAVASSAGVCLLYTVNAKDTGTSIAKSFGLEFPALNASNPGIVWEKLQVGKPVLIPTGYTTQPTAGVTTAPSCSAPAAGPADGAGAAGAAAASSAPPAASASASAPLEVVPIASSGSAAAPPSAPTASTPAAAAPPTSTPSAAAAAPPAAATGGAVPAAGAGSSSAAAAEAASTGTATAATSGCKTYTVLKGDTGYEIAKTAGITLPQLNAQNPGLVWEKLQLGQILNLPPTATGANLGSAPDCKAPAIISAPAGGAAGSGSAPPAAAATGSAPAAPPSGAASAGSAAAPPSSAAAGSGSAAAAAATAAAATGSAAAATAAPPAAGASAGTGKGGAEGVSVIKYISPASASCDNAEYKDECRTAEQAAPHISASFTKYGVDTAGEQAALLSWMIFESASFKYNKNHFPAPGRPGQGTRNMMMPNFVEEYVTALGLKSTGTDLAAMLALVSGDEYSFASSAWFYKTKCDDTVKKGLKEGTMKGWEAWLKTCVKTEIGEAGPEGRRELYDKARAALGVPIA